MTRTETTTPGTAGTGDRLYLLPPAASGKGGIGEFSARLAEPAARLDQVAGRIAAPPNKARKCGMTEFSASTTAARLLSV